MELTSIQDMKRIAALAVLLVTVLLGSGWSAAQKRPAAVDRQVGQGHDGGTVVPTGQTVRPAGKTVAGGGRPIDLALSPDMNSVYVKTDNGLVILDALSLKVRQVLPFEGGENASTHGIAASRGGGSIYLTSSGGMLWEARIGDDGKWYWNRRIRIAAPDHGDSYPCGIALSQDGSHAYVALSRNNSVAVIKLENALMEAEISVGVAPFDVALSPDGSFAYVSNWGGRRPVRGEHFMRSSGTKTLVDDRGIPCSGTVSKIDLKLFHVVAEVAVGLHPSDIELQSDGLRMFVANANSDNVSVIDAREFRVAETIEVKAEQTLPFGGITNAVALSADEGTLYAANAGNNAVAVIKLGGPARGKSKVSGFIPVGWFPSALAVGGKQLFVVNAKGEGSRQADSTTRKWHVKWQRGTLNRIEEPSQAALAKYTKNARENALIRQSLQAFERPRRGIQPVPIPQRAGEPSVFRHVVFVLKENRTYDQVFGDMKQANSDSSLCIFGREVTPNHHALAEQFVLLDNYYCNGIVSADGHQWATQGITTDYQEKAFGSWSRSYDFGTDPLAFAPTDFIWQSVLLHGLTFRNYGEFDFPALEPAATKWSEMYDEHENPSGKVDFRQWIPFEELRPYTSPTYPGWELRIPDVLRVERFLTEFEVYKKEGDWPNFVIVYLPQDHTSGMQIDKPTPRAHVSDNDLALGRLVEAISKSPFWSNTCIFVNEDDPQNGFDHVDGHRSLCLVVSPYTLRGKVVSHFYNQCSVLHTIERIFGLPPMNQLDAIAPTMEACFTTKLDFTPYTALPNIIPLDEMNAHASLPERPQSTGRQTGELLDFSGPDRINDDMLNRILWLAAKGPGDPYPARYAGAHGLGLGSLHLKLSAQSDADDEE